MRKIAFPLILAACVFLCACAKKTPEPFQPADCQRLYVVLPGNFIIDLAAGSKVVLNSSAQEFILHCSAKDAEAALELARKEGRVESEGNWRVYALEEAPADIGRPCNGGEICLEGMATVADWVEAGAQ